MPNVPRSSRGLLVSILATVIVGCPQPMTRPCAPSPPLATAAPSSAEADASCALGAALGSCLAACQAHSEERETACKHERAICTAEDRIFAEEGACRESCVGERSPALRCRPTVARIEARECVFGSHLRCHWERPEGTLTLGCCRTGAPNEPMQTVVRGGPCPALGICPG